MGKISVHKDLGMYRSFKPIFIPRWVNVTLDYFLQRTEGFLKRMGYPVGLLMKFVHEQAEVATITDHYTAI